MSALTFYPPRAFRVMMDLAYAVNHHRVFDSAVRLWFGQGRAPIEHNLIGLALFS